MRRFADQNFGLPNYFAVSDYDGDDGPPPLIEPTDIEEDKKRKEKQNVNVLQIEAILFDGEHRDNEINLTFMISQKLG